MAFIDPANQEAYFFLPTQVTTQPDRIVFACSPEKLESEYLFTKIGIKVDKTFPFNYDDFSFSNPAGTLTFKSKLNGAFHIKLTYNGISIELETWVSYNLQDAVVEVSDNFAQEIPIAKLPIVGVPGIGLEVGVGLGLFTEGDTKVSFDLTGGKAGFTAKGGIFQSPSFSSLSEKPKLNVEEIIAEGDFEVDLTFGPSLDVLSVAGLGCDIAEGVCVSAELTGDEGGRDPNPLLEVKPSNPMYGTSARSFPACRAKSICLASWKPGSSWVDTSGPRIMSCSVQNSPTSTTPLPSKNSKWSHVSIISIR